MRFFLPTNIITLFRWDGQDDIACFPVISLWVRLLSLAAFLKGTSQPGVGGFGHQSFHCCDHTRASKRVHTLYQLTLIHRIRARVMYRFVTYTTWCHIHLNRFADLTPITLTPTAHLYFRSKLVAPIFEFSLFTWENPLIPPIFTHNLHFVISYTWRL